MSAVDVHVSHGGGDPFVAEELLDGDDVHTVAVKRRRAVVPQHVRAEPAPPGRQVPGHRPGKADAQCPGADPAGVALGGLALGAQQRGARLVPAVVELAADIGDEPLQQRPHCFLQAVPRHRGEHSGPTISLSFIEQMSGQTGRAGDPPLRRRFY